MTNNAEKILFATDLSEDAPKIFEYAVRLANGLCCSLVIMHVLEGTSYAADSRLLNIISKEKLDEIKERNKEMAHDKLIAKARDGRIIHQALTAMYDDKLLSLEECHLQMDQIVIEEGHVAEMLVEKAEALGCSYIVLGHYQRGILEKGPLSSTVRGVLKRTRIPVVLVPVKGLKK
jgi:nucleotide-binding universal stress UspA family protein